MASAIVKGTSKILAKVCARSVFPHPVGPTNKIYSKHTGKSVDEISKALERDNFMTAEEAKKFGLIDSVVEKRK